MAVLIDSYMGAANTSAYMGSATLAWGQSFTTTGEVLRLQSCVFRARREGSPTGNVYARVYAHTGTYGTSSLPTGAVLATSDAIDVSTFDSLNVTNVVFTFSGANRINLSANTYYVIVLEHAGTDNDNCVVIAMTGITASHEGNACRYFLGNWEAESFDLYFAVYGVGPIVGQRYPLPAFKNS